MASYLERDQQVAVQPQIANIQAILGTAGAAQQYYAIGAAQLKNTYNSYLGLDLTHSGNQQQLSTLMQGTDKSIRLASQTNLGVADNAAKALKVFDPIVKNKDIMGDAALTRQIKGELAKAESYRLKDGGKEFNQASVTKLQNLLGLYASGDKSGWQQYYSMNEKYDPYYDKTDEIKKLQGMFKTDVIETSDTPHPGYILDHKDSSWYKNKWQQFVEANASDKLKHQLKIESDADFTTNLLINKGNPQKVYAYYDQRFQKMKEAKVSSLTDSLNRATMELKGLSVNDPEYDQKKKLYGQIIDQANKNISVANRTTLPSDIIDPSNLSRSQAYVASLHEHDYYDEIGTAFEHKELKDNLRMNGAYYANRNLQMKMLEMKQDANQFQATMDYKYTALDQTQKLAMLKEQNDLAIAQMRKNPDGSFSPLGTSYVTDQVTASGDNTKEGTGKEILGQFNEAVQSGHANLYDSALATYIGSNEVVNAINNGGNLPLNQVRTAGGVGMEGLNKIVDLLADATYGSGVAKKYGGDSSPDPEIAKAKFKQNILNTPASEVKALVNRVLAHPNAMKQVMAKIKDQPGGYKLKADIEDAERNLNGTIQSFNDTYGPAAVKVLRDAGLQPYYSPESEEYKSGLRGYEQDLNQFSLMSDKQLKLLIESQNKGLRDKIFKSSIYGVAGQLSTGAAPAFSDKYTSVEGKMEAIKKKLYGALGETGSVSANVMAEDVTVTEKTRPTATGYIGSVLSTMDGSNGEREKKLAALVQRNPAALEGYVTYGTMLDGKARIGIRLDAAKLTVPGDKDALAELEDYQNIRIATTSQLVPQQFRTKDPGYVATMLRPKQATINFNVPGTVNGGEASIQVRNAGNLNLPKFQVEGSYFVPSIALDGSIAYDAKGQLILRRIGPQESAAMMNRESIAGTGKSLDENLARDPNRIYSNLQYHASKWKAYIEEITKRKPQKLGDLPPYLVSEIEKIKPD